MGDPAITRTSKPGEWLRSGSIRRIDPVEEANRFYTMMRKTSVTAASAEKGVLRGTCSTDSGVVIIMKLLCRLSLASNGNFQQSTPGAGSGHT